MVNSKDIKIYFKPNEWLLASPPYRQRFQVISRFEVSDSEVYLCRDVTNNDEEVVVKAELISGRESRLEKEWEFYQKLSAIEDFRIVLYDRIVGLNHRFLMLKKLGNDLQTHLCNEVNANRWTNDHLKRYTIQMIGQLKSVHSVGIVHLDPKPNNFVTDENDTTRIRLIDFDVSKRYLTDDNEHIGEKDGLLSQHIKGNRFYLSIYGHNGVEQSRRDDMLFLGYSLVWMARRSSGILPSLPWTRQMYLEKDGTEGMVFNNNLYNHWMCDQKKNWSYGHKLHELCDGFPYLVQYMQYCNQLKFADSPDYDYLKSLFT